MGYAIAEAALEAKHEVILISGPVCLAPPAGATLIRILTSDELFAAVHEHAPHCDVLVMCAAVADYKPATVAEQKSEKQTGAFSLSLTSTKDILASLPRTNRPYLVIGFAAQTHDLERNARRKLFAKNCDAIIANDVSKNDSGMESDDNEVTIFTRNGDEKRLARASKKIIAREILKKIIAMRE